MRQLIILTLIILTSCSSPNQKERLFTSLYQETFQSKARVTIEFTDSTTYIVSSFSDTLVHRTKGTWRIDNGLTGTYLVMDSSEMKLDEISDSVITFTKGEFQPRFVKVTVDRTLDH